MATYNRHETPHQLFISQKVIDIAVPTNERLEREIGILSHWLHGHSFIPGNKVTARVTPTEIEGGVLYANISDWTSGVEASIRQPFPLDVVDGNGDMDLISVFSKVKGVQIRDGGNIQNAIVNMVIASMYLGLANLLRSRNSSLRITVASSSDPFVSFPPAVANAMRKFCDIHILDIPDRIALHLPFKHQEHSGTLAIASQPLRTNEAVQKLIAKDERFKVAFRRATCFISADPIFDQLSACANPGYVYIINASTAFRSLVATESFDRAVILPMNNGEAGDVCWLLLQRGLEEELNRTARPPFESPINSSGSEIDMDALRQLDESLDILRKYNPPHRCIGRPSFTCPITFGPDGGLVISASHQDIACFTSTPEKEDVLLNEFGDPAKLAWDRIYEVGAGDSVATIIALFNAIDPLIFIEKHMRGREPQDRQLTQLAGAIFVSSLGRIVGNFLVRTTHTNWSNINKTAFFRLLDEVARESLHLARLLVKKLHTPVLGQLKKWGIRVLAWKPGEVAYPERTR